MMVESDGRAVGSSTLRTEVVVGWLEEGGGVYYSLSEVEYSL